MEGLKRYPRNSSTRKGNLAEIVLADYVIATTDTHLPIFRLRYNPNVDQSMKGDDVLAFDLDRNPVRILVGEAKFRSTSTAAAVAEIVANLARSHKAGLPVSLQFVADRLFEEGKTDVGRQVMNCAVLFARGILQLEYVGLLLSDLQAATRVDSGTPDTEGPLAMISVALDEPESFVDSCFDGLE
jgi:hypothetical protein